MFYGDFLPYGRRKNKAKTKPIQSQNKANFKSEDRLDITKESGMIFKELGYMGNNKEERI